MSYGEVPVKEAQGAALGHLIALFGGGTLYTTPDDARFGYVWFRTKTQEWCLNKDGDVVGWNDR